jgi:hypothetical protein
MLLRHLASSDGEEAEESSLGRKEVVEALIFAGVLGIESDCEERSVFIIKE